MLTLFGPPLAAFAITFGPQEYVALMVFAFAALSALVGKNMAKTLIGAVLGLIIATIGVDANTGVNRFTFDSPHLLSGVDFLVVVIGLFGIAELLHLVEAQLRGTATVRTIDKTFVSLRDLLHVKWTALRGAVIGFVIGILPGTGASVASAVAYGMEKRLATGDQRREFGEGAPRGLASPESANNAAAGGAMVPMLTLGIPGSGTTAILLGALLLFNVTPGPMMFEQRPEIAWGLIASMYIGNVALLVLNLPLVGLFARLLAIPQAYLIPVIAMLAFVGVYSVVGSAFDLYLMLGLGAFGWVLRKLNFSLAPVILGVVLGGLFENNLRRALSISNGDWGVLIESTSSLVLYALTVAMLVLPPAIARFRRGNLADIQTDDASGSRPSTVD